MTFRMSHAGPKTGWFMVKALPEDHAAVHLKEIPSLIKAIGAGAEASTEGVNDLLDVVAALRAEAARLTSVAENRGTLE